MTRRAWALLHRWLGLGIALAVVAIAASGSALVWRAPLDRLLSPDRYAVGGATMLPLDRYVATARARLGDVRIGNIVLPDAVDAPVTVTAEDGRRLYLDPPTARLLAVRGGDDGGAVRVLHRLHGGLMIPGIGRAIVGWVGVATIVLALSGLWLWRPARARRHRAGRAAAVHHVVGLWGALPLLGIALTGTWIAFPAAFALLTGEAPRAAATRLPPPSRPLARPALSVAAAAALGAGVERTAPLRTIVWPTATRADWTLAYATQPMRVVTVADDSGTVAPVVDRGPTLARWVRRLHDGTDMGTAWRLLLSAGGLVPLLLATTGVAMWWRRPRRRG
ncbi:hypothetical protein ASG29_01390 [Sphingomonas sp. Leaf412]|uniref:PepSY-associated TM helix domain-containing protein n=1 Tax=Sphingomonas sp. Leaf412 TaxID=1736370 RepID=UPI0006F772C6|nr:PepSY-associated TM helix domain-containing protein [Sphingomonas sp. Leaf412]KQT34838.1 hypothetical protein ASG29_01390 [Sphingomonas sp. Leaf412]